MCYNLHEIDEEFLTDEIMNACEGDTVYEWDSIYHPQNIYSTSYRLNEYANQEDRDWDLSRVENEFTRTVEVVLGDFTVGDFRCDYRFYGDTVHIDTESQLNSTIAVLRLHDKSITPSNENKEATYYVLVGNIKSYKYWGMK